MSILCCFAFGCSAPEAGESPPGESSAAFSTAPGEPNHEEITRTALEFLRPEIVTALVAGNVSTDVEYVLVNANHFDDCNFSGGSQVVSSNQAEAVRLLNPSLPPGTAMAAILPFSRSLHALQDFYAHTNWVELGGEVLVDSSLSAFASLTPYSTIESSGFVVVQGAKPKRSALSRKTEEPYPATAVVTYRSGRSSALGLISGTVDYEAGDYCPASIAMTHEELNKDKTTNPGRTAQHFAAKALAIRQTRHEWCRLAALASAAWGEAGTAQLATWLAEGATQPDCTTE